MKSGKAPMTTARFAELLAAYGARPEQWPAAEREAAEALVRAGGEPARLFADAERLDGWLDTYEIAEVSPRLRARVLEVPVAASRGARKLGWKLAWAFAFSCFVGVASGVLSAPEQTAEDEWAELAEVSFYADLDLGDEELP